MAINSHAEGITIYFEGNDVEFKKSAFDVKKALELLQRETKVLKKEFQQTGDIEKFKAAIKNLEDEQVVATRLVAEWAKEIEAAKREEGAYSKRYKDGLKQWEIARGKLAAINIELEKNNDLLVQMKAPDDIKKMADGFANLGDKLENVGDIALNVADAFSTISRKATEGLQKATQTAIDFQSAFADVRKTVEETATMSYDQLYEDIRELSKVVPVTADELARLAGLAGQMNVEADDIIPFIKAVVDFANSTNIGAEDAVQEIAQIYNVIGKGGDFSSLNNLLSTIVDLGNNSATTEKDIVEMLRNISSSASRVEMTEQQMAALAATLASLGLDKGGASAISTLMTKIDMAVDTNSKSLADWADAAGMSVKEFKKAWGTDAAGALASLLDNLRKTADEGGSLNQEFEDLGIKEMRRVDTLGRLVNANDVYRESLERANKAFEEGTALSEEASKRYETVESKIQIMKNTFSDFALSIGNLFLPIVEKIIEIATKIGEWLNNLSPVLQGFIAIITSIIAVIAPIAGIIGNIFTKIAPFFKTTLPALITGNAKLAAILKGVGGALKFLTGPIGIAIALISALALSNSDVRDKLKEVARTVLGVFKNAFTIIVNVVRIVWELLKGLVAVLKEMWTQFSQSQIGQGFITIIKAIIEFVGILVGWLEKLTGWLGKVLGFFADALGLASDLSATTNNLTTSANRMGNGYNMYQSGGYMSDGYMAGGMTFNNTFTITGINNIDQDTANRLADMMTNRINNNLGRMYS